MKNNILKYILFSLILLFGINFYNDEVYAEFSDIPVFSQNGICPASKNNGEACTRKNSIPYTLTCTYKPIRQHFNGKDTKDLSDISDIKIELKYEMDLGISNGSDAVSMKFKLKAYSNGREIDLDREYDNYNDSYKFSCPNSIAYYGTITNSTKFYTSRKKQGGDNWTINAKECGFWGSFTSCKGKKVTIYTLSDNPAPTAIFDDNNNISLLDGTYIDKENNKKVKKSDGCEFMTANGDKAKFKTVFANWDGKLAIRFMLSVNGGKYQYTNLQMYKTGGEERFRKALISGDCSDDGLKFMYVPTDNAGLYFSNIGTVHTDAANILDGSDDKYTVYQNVLLRETVDKNAEKTTKKIQKCDEILKPCENNSDSNECKEAMTKAEAECSDIVALIREDCSSENMKYMSNSRKKECEEAEKIIEKFKENNYTFTIDLSPVTCQTLGTLIDKLQTYFTIIKILTPVLIIGLSVVDFVQATASSDDDALKKAKDKFVKRLVIGVIIFLLPYLVNMILQLIDDYYQTSTCGIK